MSSATNALLGAYAQTPFSPENQERSARMQMLYPAQAAQLKQQTALQAQQTQNAALEAQLTQQRISDQRAIGQAWRDWDPQKDPSGQGLIQSAVTNGATPASVMEVQQHMAQYSANLATADKTRLENQKVKDDHYAGVMQAIIDADPERQEELFQQHRADFAKDAPGEQLPDHFTAKDAQTFQKLHQFKSQQIENELKQRQTKQAEAEAALKEAETEKQKHINALLTQGQQAAAGGVHPIDAILSAQDDPGMNASLKAMYDRGAKFINPNTGISELQEQALKTAAEFKHEISKVNNPQIRAGEVAKAVDVAQAEAPIHTAQAVATETATAPIKTQIAVNTQRALNSTAALGNVPPHLIPQYQGEVSKIANAYGDAANAANEMQEMIDMMRGGNKIAYAYSPTTGVLTINSANGIKRVNMAEIGQYGGAGSFADKVMGFFGKQLTGESVPSDIVDAMEQFHSTLGENARNSAVGKIQSLNKLYGATTDPEAILVKPTKATAPPMRGAQPPKGNGQKLTDPNVVRQYLQNAGGDKDKARQLAKQDGWTF